MPTSDFIQRLESEARNTEMKLELPLRNPVCIKIEQLLLAIIEQQDGGKSNFFIDCQKEFGASLAHSLSVAADDERRKLAYMRKIEQEKQL